MIQFEEWSEKEIISLKSLAVRKIVVYTTHTLPSVAAPQITEKINKTHWLFSMYTMFIYLRFN